MKKTIPIITALSMLLCSCSADASGSIPVSATGRDTISVVCTSFAYYDWTKNIAEGTDIDISYLLSDGVDMHSYQPTAGDLMKITECDLLICGGGESEDWIDKTNREKPVLHLLECGALEEETVEGMQHEDDEEEHEEKELDEHIWLSPYRASLCCDEICKALGTIAPSESETLGKNNESYKEKLSALDAGYRSVASLPEDTIIVADRFPFRYLANDYSMKYFAAFPGCSAESEASFETVTFLTQKCNESGAATIFRIDGSDGKLAQTIADGCTKEPVIAQLDSMQSVSQNDIDNGTNYISVMESDLAAIKAALS